MKSNDASTQPLFVNARSPLMTFPSTPPLNLFGIFYGISREIRSSWAFRTIILPFPSETTLLALLTVAQSPQEAKLGPRWCWREKLWVCVWVCVCGVVRVVCVKYMVYMCGMYVWCTWCVWCVCVMCSVCTYVWCQGMHVAPCSQAPWLHHVCPLNLCEIATTPFSTQAPDQSLRSSWGGMQWHSPKPGTSHSLVSLSRGPSLLPTTKSQYS